LNLSNLPKEVFLDQAAEIRANRAAAMIYRRKEIKLGVTPLRSDRDLSRLVDERLPLASVDSLSNHGMTDKEIYSLIVPRRTLAHRKTRRESLTHDESDRAVRIRRIASLAEKVFGADTKAGRWLRKPKTRFDGRTPLEMLWTEAGGAIGRRDAVATGLWIRRLSTVL
jgi:putative toxin-antitoxin system antitoxin component (TIGR02293 family)